ncbi:MAG: hypothetical protein M3198_02395, partial [Actinomycetota bacterium]|nr:hypothetical protein [Actinomycetota bacterium]
LVLIAGAVGLLVGLVAGLVLGSDDPAPEEAAREVRVTLTEASSLLEVEEIEYEEALEDGSGAGEQEYEGARDALARSRARWEEARPSVRIIAPDSAAQIDRHYAELEQAVDDEALPEEVNALIGDLSEALDPEEP